MSLGSLWAPFGHPLCSLWAPLRSLWPLLGGSWGTLGTLWDHFAPPEGYLEGLWWLFWVCWGYFGQCFGMLEIFFIYFRNVLVLIECQYVNMSRCQYVNMWHQDIKISRFLRARSHPASYPSFQHAPPAP